MVEELNTHLHKLMLKECEKRFRAAKLLSQSGDNSDSAYLLELIGFEILLKIVVEQHTKSTAHGHCYRDLFVSLPDQTQANILSIARNHIGPSALDSDHMSVFVDLGTNFVKLRYPYERYALMSEQEYAGVGTEWIEAGAEVRDAHYRYHPQELDGLVCALQQVAVSG